MDHTNEAVARIAMLSAKAAALCDEFENTLGPVMRPALPSIPMPAPRASDEPMPVTVPAKMPQLFANLHEQMDVLEDRLLLLVNLVGRIEL